jgi:hypothetical protein
MRYRLTFLSLIIILCSFKNDGKKSYPQDYFRSPVDRTIYLSGTFGELRPNHFHSGIDIKAHNGRVGQDLFAAAEGTISRIKVQAGGYGNVLYINHPRGYTTVYAHMHKFTKEIAEYVKSEQYKRKSFEVDLYPPAGKFTFDKGQVIGKLGTSGRSFGPHLHFEIRDSKTEKPINPLLFGFNVKDNITPKLHQVKAYFLNDKLNTLATKTFDLIKLKSGKYKLRQDTINLGAWRVGFGIKAYDHLDGAPNWNGVYQVDLLENNSLSYSYEMETFAFSESRYINAHLDYEEQVAKKSYFNRLFRLPGNRLSIYDEQQTKGIIKLSNRQATKITMEVKDAAGNLSTLEFWVKRTEVKDYDGESFNYVLPFDEENLIDNATVRVYFPKGTFYENLYMKYRTSRDDSQDVYSPVYHLHDYKTPVHKYFDIAIEPAEIPEELREKAFIAYCGRDNEMLNCGGKWENGKVSTKVRSLGDYCVMLDTKPPTITPGTFKSNMKGYSRMTFKIKDNFPTTGRAADLKYSATVDGQWILVEYDAKSDLLIHRFDGKIPPGKHELKLKVTDDRGNVGLFEKAFTN